MSQQINVFLTDDQLLENIGNSLNARTRRDILRLCSFRNYSIYQLAEILNMAIPTISFHVKILQKAGLVNVIQTPHKKGNEKQVTVSFSNISISKSTNQQPIQKAYHFSLPVGSYTDFKVVAPCCIVNKDGSALGIDEPGIFYSPKRFAAELISFSDGYLEYSIPTYKFKNETIFKFIVSVELCAETPFFNNSWQSDITFWVNNIECCTYQCKGDYGERRGYFTPKLWTHNATQYGFLQKISIDSDGVYLNEKKESSVNLNDLHLTERDSIQLRIGIKENAKHKGGINLFGKNFGDHPQNILVQVIIGENYPDANLE